MRIGVVSDSHGSTKYLRDAILAMGEIDLLLHAGDHYKDAIQLQKEFKIPFYAVMGNCDWSGEGPEEEIIEIEGKKIYLTHGHQFNVKSGNQIIINKFKNSDYDLVVFGHTHIAEKIPVGNGYIFNPGSIARPRSGKRTYGIIESKKYGFEPHIKEVSV